MFNGGSPSVADIAAVTGKNDGDNNGWGGNGAWWVLIILFALFGWGRNGFGNNGNCGNEGGGTTVVTVPMPMTGGCCGGGAMGTWGGFTDAAIQRGFDNQAVIQKLDGLNSGVCSLGYDQLAQMNGINANIMQTGFGIQQGLNAVQVGAMQNANALSTQLAQCCCENRQGQADIKYAMATDTCSIVNAIQQMGQNIIQNDNANYRQLHDENVQLQMQAYRDQLAAKDQAIWTLQLGQSQSNQNQFFQGQLENLYDKLSPCPKPAYWVQNPNCCQSPWGPFTYGMMANAFNQNNGTCCNQCQYNR